MIVKVYSTQMGEKSVRTSATTWGQLQNDLNREGIAHGGMKSVIGESKLTLEADAAVLPSTDFTLFLMPKKTKAGYDINTMGYKDLRAEICTILNGVKGEYAKLHFNVGKNYTTKGTEELRGLLATWTGATLVPVEASSKKKSASKTVATSRPEPTREVVEKVEAVVESVKEAKQEVVAEEVEVEVEMDKHPAVTFLESAVKELRKVDFSGASDNNAYLVDLGDSVQNAKDIIFSIIDSFTTHLKSVAEFKAKAEAKAKEEAEAKAKEDEARQKEEAERQIIAEEKRHHEEDLRKQEAEMRKMFGDVS